MPSQDAKILDFNQYHKFDKTQSIFYAGLKSLIRKKDGCKNMIWTFDDIKTNRDVYRDEDCKKSFC